MTVDVDGEDQDWLFLFKNETHNHPTEIEPFGGAAACVGGAIRDPLSGRSYVYQAMRVTGAADPTVPVSETIAGKLPQRKIVTTAAAGYSSYGNQIGLATGQVSSSTTPATWPAHGGRRRGGATPASHVRRECPAPGDKIILLGGRTGRDGIGGATGSSKAHNVESIEKDGAEVQKATPPWSVSCAPVPPRDACRLINAATTSARAASVAVGELADGLYIDLDMVTKKYDGLDGTELAISESRSAWRGRGRGRRREFMGYAAEENLEATVIAEVTCEPRVRMAWQGDAIVDLSRDFLNSNGAPKYQDVHVVAQGIAPIDPDSELAEAALEEFGTLDGIYESTVPMVPGAETCDSFHDAMVELVSDLNVCSNKGLSERFDSTIGAATVLMPFGGERQLTPNQAMVAKFPVDGETTTVSGMAWGFNPTSWTPTSIAALTSPSSRALPPRGHWLRP
ncbi:MAG: AIR synthase-related protein [Collinsella intestinalis]